MIAEQPEHRELTLMFSDIVGYSRLMGRDEAMTIEMLGDYRTILLGHIHAHGGIFIEFAGDAIFSRFDKAAAAVAAAVDIQKHLQQFNQGRDKDLPRLQTRIGIHKGQVILRDNAVLGDDVNIAARLEPLAVADGICISKTVYDEIRTQLREPIKPLGPQSLKNIQQKIRAYLIKPSGIVFRDHLHYFLQDTAKRISANRYVISACLLMLVLAGFYFIPRWLVPGYAANYVEVANFQNVMNEKGQADYFSSGITEAVRSQLADMRDVYVVEADKGINAPIRLEGSVQKMGDNLRIAYRIMRRHGNVQIAGGKLDGAYKDIFILQDRLVGEIAKNLAKEFKLQNFRPAPLKLTSNVTAYDYYLQGMEYLNKPNSHESVDEAIQRFNTALVHDQNFALANAGLCNAYWKKYEISKSANWLIDAESHCLLALRQDETSPSAYKAIGQIYRDTGKYQRAIEYLEKGLKIDQNSATTAVVLASVYNLINEKEKAENLYIFTIKQFPQSWIALDGYGYFLTINGRYDEAIKYHQKVLDLLPENVTTLNNLGVNFFYKDELKRAANAFEKAALYEPSSLIFANIGSIYYSLRNFNKSIEMNQKALKLEPYNCQWMIYIGDAYKFIKGENENADKYFRDAIVTASKDIQINPGIPKSYRCLASAAIFFGDIKKANEMLDEVDKLEPTSTETYYTHLRVAVVENNDEKIRIHVKHLLETEYSVKLLLAEPDFEVLRDARFSDLFTQAK